MRTTTTTTTTDTISKFAAFAYMSFRHLSVIDLIFFGFVFLLLLLLLVKREGEKRRKEGKENCQIKSNQTNLLFASREGVDDVQPIAILFRSVLFCFPLPKEKKIRNGREVV